VRYFFSFGAGLVRYVFATPGAERRVMHIQRHTETGLPLYSPLCSTRLRFNRSINAPFGLGRPVCRHCLRVLESNQDQVQS